MILIKTKGREINLMKWKLYSFKHDERIKNQRGLKNPGEILGLFFEASKNKIKR